MEQPQSEDPELLTIAINHAWAWYETSFSHRLQMVNFFFFIAAANVAGYIAALQARLDYVAGGLAFIAAGMTATFMRLAPRVRRRIEVAAIPLNVLQDRLATMVEVPELRMVSAVTAPQPRWSRTNEVARALYLLLMLGFLSASAYAFFR